MSLNVQLSTLARNDIEEIWSYIASDNVEAADRLIDRVLGTCYDFTHTPEMGRSRNDLLNGVRSFPVGSYLIIYRILPDYIDVLRILHSSRNIEDLFLRGTQL